MLAKVKKEKKALLVFVFILIISFGFRFSRVLFEKTPVFGDEAIYIRWSQVMRAEPSLRFVPLTDGKQPLFMWVTIPLLKIFDDPLIAGRMLSVYTGVVTTAGVFFLSLLLFKSKNTALIAGLIYAISPFTVFFDSLALADSMLSMFGVWSLVFAVITVKKVRLDSAMLSGFCLGGALLTKSPAIFFATLLPLTLILHKWPKKFKDKFKNMSVFVFLFTFTYVIAYGLYNILRLGQDFHMVAIRNRDYVYSIGHLIERPLDPLLPFLKMILEYFWMMGPGAILILFIIGVWFGLKRFKKETFILLSWGILTLFAVTEFSKTMTARYIYFTVPYLFILASISVSFITKFRYAKQIHFGNGLRSHIGNLIVTMLIILFTFYSLFLDFQLITNPQTANLPRSERSGFYEEWTSGYGIKESAGYIVNYHKVYPNEKIVVGTEGYFGTLPDGLQIYLNRYPEITVIGVGIDLKEIPQSLKESKEAGNKTFLVINNSRLKENPDSMGLELLASFSKALRVPGSREYNLNGPQEVLYLFDVKTVSQI